MVSERSSRLNMMNTLAIAAIYMIQVKADEEIQPEALALPNPWPTWWIVISVIISCLQLFVAICAMVFLKAILSNKTVRESAYNIYLVLIVAPDAMLNFCTGITSTMRLFAKDQSLSVIILTVWDFATAFYYVSNFWMNLIIAYEIHKLARLSRRRIKTKPPLLRKVYIQGACVYSLAIFMGIWLVLEVPWSPGHRGPENNTLFGSPEGGVFTKIQALLLSSFQTFLLPSMCVLFISFDMWRRNLLPKSGRTRVLSLFFLRILLVFFAFYIPGVLLAFVKLSTKSIAVWYITHGIRALLEVLQAILTLYMACKKYDIGKAVEENVTRIKIRRRPNSAATQDTSEESASGSRRPRHRQSFVASQVERRFWNWNIDHQSKWEEEDVWTKRRLSLTRISLFSSQKAAESNGVIVENPNDTDVACDAEAMNGTSAYNSTLHAIQQVQHELGSDISLSSDTSELEIQSAATNSADAYNSSLQVIQQVQSKSASGLSLSLSEGEMFESKGESVLVLREGGDTAIEKCERITDEDFGNDCVNTDSVEDHQC